MATEKPEPDQADLREELHVLDEELAELRATTRELRAQIGGRSEGAVDPEDVASTLQGVEEQEALIGALEQRRTGLLQRLTGA